MSDSVFKKRIIDRLHKNNIINIDANIFLIADKNNLFFLQGAIWKKL